MKRLIALAFFILMCAVSAHAQNPNVTIQGVKITPSGNCPIWGMRLTAPGGALYSCQNGTWALISGGGSTSIAIGSTPTSGGTSGNCLTTVSNVVQSQACGGAGTAYKLTDFDMTKTSGTIETMCSTCGATTPSNILSGSVPFTLLTSPTVTISGTTATDNVYWYLDAAHTLTAGYNGAETLTCASGITCVTGVTGFPAGSTPLWITTLASNVWDAIAPGTMDKRAVYGTTAILAGTNVSVTQNLAGALTINATGGGTVTDSIQFPAASIQNAGAAITLWDTGVTNGGHTSASGMGGATTNPAVLTFDTSGLGEARFYYRLPHTWTGTISLTFGTESVAGAGVTNTISVKTVCVASGGVYLGPTYNGAQTVNVVSNSNAAVVVEGTISTLTTTGCSVDNLLIVDVIKSDANAALNVMYAAMQVSHQ